MIKEKYHDSVKWGKKDGREMNKVVIGRKGPTETCHSSQVLYVVIVVCLLVLTISPLSCKLGDIRK